MVIKIPLLSATPPDLPLAREAAHRFFPWVTASMACLLALMLSLGVSLYAGAAGRESDYRHSVMIQLPSGVVSEARATRGFLKKLQGLEGVASARLMAREDVKAMVKPWFSDAEVVDALPLPAVIEVTLSPSGDALATLKKAVYATYPGAELDAHEAWAGHLGAFTGFLGAAVWVVVVLVAAATALTVALVLASSFRLHARAVRLLHQFGATDAYILRQFQANAVRTVWFAALPGVAIAVLLYAILMAASLPVDAAAPRLVFSWWLLPAWALLPFALALLASLTARAVVSRLLARLP